MRRKLRVFSNIAIITLSVCMFAFGVYAASTVSVTTSGTIRFEATGVYASITRRVTGNVGDDIVNGPITIGSDATSPVVMGNNETLEFENATTSIVMTFTIKNEATEQGRILYATLIDNENVAPNNVSIVSEQLGSEIEIEPGQTKTIVITLSVQEPNNSASAEYDYTISLKNSSMFTMLNDTNATFKLTTTKKVSTFDQEGNECYTESAITFYTLDTISNAELTKVTIPETYNNIPVMGISNKAFKNNAIIESIRIPNSICEVAKDAFDGTKLIYIDNDIRYVKSATNSHHICVGMVDDATITFLSIHNDTKIIASNAFNSYFDDTSVGMLTIPDNCLAIGSYAFAYNSFTDLSLNDKVIYIGDHAMDGCHYMTPYSLSLPNSLTFMGVFAFNDMGSYQADARINLSIGSGLKYLPYCGFYGAPIVGSLTIPGTVESVEGNCFGCNRLTSITIEEGVKYIGGALNSNGVCQADSAFMGSENMSISIPSTVLSLGPNSFGGTQGTRSVYVMYSGSSWETLIENSHEQALASCTISGV